MSRQKRLHKQRRHEARVFTLRLAALYQLQILLFRLDVKARGLTYAEADEALALQQLLMLLDGRNCEVQNFHLVRYHRKPETTQHQLIAIGRKERLRCRGTISVGGIQVQARLPSPGPLLEAEADRLRRRLKYPGGRKARRAAHILKTRRVWHSWMTSVVGMASVYGLVANWAGKCVVGGGV